MSLNTILPVILCGGSGTRLWPASRKSFPKQFLSLADKDTNSLLQQTIIRIEKLKNILDPIFICNEEHRFIVAEQIRETNIKPNSIILEPFGRNTAPAITIAALKALEKGKDTNLLILSSDHFIENNEKFLEIIEAGIEYSKKGMLVTFGVLPDTPATGYGYIKSEEPLENLLIEGKSIKSFIEKPDKKTAELLLKDKRFSWNSGIFLFKASAILKAIEQFSPEILNFCQKALSKDIYDLDFQRLDKDYFKKCPDVSIDIAVMEKTKNGIVLPLPVGWSDIGSWNSVWNISQKDSDGNVIYGNVEIEDTQDCYFKSENRLIAAIGLKNLAIIETSDAILVVDKNKSQEVKNIVQKLRDKNIPEALEHQKSFRPWGNYQSLVKKNKWQVKLINVKPGESLSLQKHRYRSEHWVVVSGQAKVEINEKVFNLYENQSTYIPSGSKHRLSNPGNEDLKIIEIQSGTYLGEDDIIRFDDNYGRTN